MIEVHPHPKVRVKFSKVSKEGTVSATIPTSYAPFPAGKFLEVFEVKNTATFSGFATVAISFDGTKLNEDQKKNLSVFRNDPPGSGWTNVTTTIDTVNNIAYGATDHFSVFGVH